MSIKVSGFTFIKNGLTLGYPIKESIESISPLCDEVVINVGYDEPGLEKDDGTYEYLRDNFTESKYKFLKSLWNPEQTSKGIVLSEQTNIALNKCSGDICQYIQGDEVIHEDDLVFIEQGVKDLTDDVNLQGLIYNYIHFYGNIDIYKYTRNIYRREVRTIKNNKNIKSWLDAQGFRYQDGSKINAKLINARIFHYGWAREQQLMDKKIGQFDKLYHGKDHVNKDKFTYNKIYGLKKFTKTHPGNMSEWIEKNRNSVDIMKMKSTYKFKDLGLAISDLIEYVTDYRMGEFKNYKKVK